MIRQAVLLVGGRGTRLWPLTDSVPKGLMPVAGTPFIELQFRLLRDVGVEQVVLAIGRSHEEAWREYAAGRTDPAIELAVEDEPLDTAGPVTSVRHLLDDRFLVLNGDVVLEAPLVSFVEAAPDLDAVLALVPVSDPSAYGVVVTDGHGTVERFVEKPAPGTEPANTVNAGMYLMRREALARYQPGPLSFERVVFPDLASRRRLGGAVVDGMWLDIGTAPLYLEAHAAAMTGRSRLVTADKPHVHEDVQMEGSVAGSWSWIGPGAVVGAGAVVEESVILPGAHIERGTVVSRGIVGWDAVVGPDARVTGAAMVGAGAAVGAGCELDAEVRIAPAAQLSPGSVTFSAPA